jgi:hypothetical protein
MLLSLSLSLSLQIKRLNIRKKKMTKMQVTGSMDATKLSKTKLLQLCTAGLMQKTDRTNIGDVKKLYPIKKATTAGFEPARPKGTGLAGRRVNHSATLSFSEIGFLIYYMISNF